MKMIKFILNFFRSLRFRIFFADILICLVTVVIMFFTAYHVMIDSPIDNQIEKVSDYAKELATKIRLTAYLANNNTNPDFSKEIKTVADLYEGRILIIDSDLHVVDDSYNTEVGKTLISEEAIKAIKGISSKYINKASGYVELAFPIIDNEAGAGAMADGGIVISFSLKEIYENSHYLRTALLTVCIPGFIVAFLFAVFHSTYLTKPINKVTQSLENVSEGYVESEIPVKGFSEFRKMGDSVNHMISRLSALEESRQEFVSNVSHELKTPITSIKVLADSLLMQPDAPAEVYQEFLGDINNEIDRENQIISDLLALVKLDRKNGDMHIAQVSINELLEIIMKRIKPIAQQQHIELILESYRKVIAEVDEVKLSLAISNLIENGVKYNKEEGYVKVILDSDHKYFTLTVEDNGIGIPKESLGLIFDRFYRVDKMRARQTGGTGLGLSITQSVVLMHKGTIKVESEEGAGTTFIIKIPLSYISEESVDD